MKGCDCGNTAELYTFCFAVDKFKNKASSLGALKSSLLFVFFAYLSAPTIYTVHAGFMYFSTCSVATSAPAPTLHDIDIV